MTDTATLRRISPDQLAETLAQVREREQRELVLLGPDAYPDELSQQWPNELKGRSVLQLTGRVAWLEQKLLELDQLQLLILWSIDIGNAGAQAIAENLTQLTSEPHDYVESVDCKGKLKQPEPSLERQRETK